jgi:hypothetical protein
MVPLDSPLWKRLPHMYTGGEGQPDANVLLQRIEAAASDEEFRLATADFFEAVYHQGDFCLASYAVVPHLARMFEAVPVGRRSQLLLMVGLIEDARRQNWHVIQQGLLRIEVPEEIVSEYHATIKRVPRLIARCAESEWSREEAIDLAAALLFVKGFGDLGEAVSDFRPNGAYRAVQCRECGKWVQVPKPGEPAEPGAADRPRE